MDPLLLLPLFFCPQDESLPAEPTEAGIEVELTYALDVVSNVAGGVRRDTELLGNLDVLVTADLEELLGWWGARAFLYGLGNHGGSLSAAVGDFQGVDNIEAPSTFKLYQAWIEQGIGGTDSSLLFGLYDVNSEFDVMPSAGLFLQSSHGIGAEFAAAGRNGPSIFPTTSLALRFRARSASHLYVRAVVADGVPGDPADPAGTQVLLDADDGLLLVGEIGYHAEPLQVACPASDVHIDGFGKFAVGVWGYTAELDDVRDVDGLGDPIQRRGTPGLYAFADRRLTTERLDPAQGLAGFARAGAADGDVDPIDAYLGGGLVYTGLLEGRDEDLVGLGVAAAHFGSKYREAMTTTRPWDEWEVAVELTYHAHVTPWCSLQPTIQYVANPGGDPRSTTQWSSARA